MGLRPVVCPPPSCPPEGGAMPLKCSLAPLRGARVRALDSGGVASLDHRLIAPIPSGNGSPSETTSLLRNHLSPQKPPLSSETTSLLRNHLSPQKPPLSSETTSPLGNHLSPRKPPLPAETTAPRKPHLSPLQKPAHENHERFSERVSHSRAPTPRRVGWSVLRPSRPSRPSRLP
jgi:hypothetical protein